MVVPAAAEAAPAPMDAALADDGIVFLDRIGAAEEADSDGAPGFFARIGAGELADNADTAPASLFAMAVFEEPEFIAAFDAAAMAAAVVIKFVSDWSEKEFVATVLGMSWD